jgi:hypothetical protein
MRFDLENLLEKAVFIDCRFKKSEIDEYPPKGLLFKIFMASRSLKVFELKATKIFG